MTDAQILDLDGFGPVRVQPEDDGGVSLISESLDTWLIQLQPAVVSTDDGERVAAAAPVGAAVASALALALPQLGSTVKHTGELVVRFAPAIQRGLADGSLKLMSGGAGLRAVAVSTSTGAIAGNAVVVGSAGAAAAPAAVAMLPVVLAAGAAFAATWAQQRWMERTFAGFQASLHRIETRLRDADLGRIDAAERLLALIGPDIMTGEVPAQLRQELAIAHHEIDAIYCSRLRFIARFTEDLDRWQEQAVKDDGRRVAWTSQVAKAFSDDNDPTVDELVVFFQSLLTRARTTAATAAILAADGDAAASLRTIDELQSSIRRDYYGIHNRLSALVRNPIDTAKWKQRLSKADESSAHETVKLLAGNVDQIIGGNLPEPDQVVELPIGRLTVAA